MSAWGEPDSHKNCQEYHPDVWQIYVDKLKGKWQEVTNGWLDFISNYLKQKKD